MLDGPSKAVQHVIEDKTGEKVELTPENLPQLPVVTVRKCTDCTVVISTEVAAVKLMLEGCSNTTVILKGKVLTETLEVWGCSACALQIASPLKTVQVDACDNLKLQYQHASDFDRCLSAGAFALALTFLDAPVLNGTVDLAELRAQMPDKALSAETDQFITRKIDGTLLTELIVRLSNDFPTTQREVIAARSPCACCWPIGCPYAEYPSSDRVAALHSLGRIPLVFSLTWACADSRCVAQVVEFASKTRMQKDKLDEVVNGMLGSSLGKGLTETERVQMVEMVQSQSETAAAANAATEGTAAGRHAARVDFKKKAGNEAFKATEYQQAAVAYTEALALIASAPRDCGEEAVVPPAQTAAIRCNRAACFLKLGRYAQARDDAQAATDLQPTYAKAHFRLALAQQAENDFGGACTSFSKALQLEPKNKEAQAGLRMAEVQAERQRRQEAS